jgi:enamine deaminase RidA (YjgF/YER057c/UK114 family)
VSGQLATDPDDDSLPLPEGIEAQTRKVMDNLKRALGGAGADRRLHAEPNECADCRPTCCARERMWSDALPRRRRANCSCCGVARRIDQ